MGEPVNHEPARQDTALEERLNTTPAEYKTDAGLWAVLLSPKAVNSLMQDYPREPTDYI